MKITELIERVREIDKKAASYIETEAEGLKSYHVDSDENNLSSIFIWQDTPQGQKYWSEIERKLEGGK